MRTCLQKEHLVGRLPTARQLRTSGTGKRAARHTRRVPGPHLCGLTLLLELLQLLGGEEANRLVASNELRARWHGGEDDVAA